MTASALYTFTMYVISPPPYAFPGASANPVTSCLPFASSVQILGSWDNFNIPYKLEKDRQRGQGYWSGCHTFENIICNGDPDQRLKRRSGALEQGGLYWYHVRIDDWMLVGYELTVISST